jgi:predicted nucleotidyltransferase
MSKSIVEAVFGTGAKSKVLQWLYLAGSSSAPVGARALARLAAVPYGSINKTLQELVADQLVVREDSAHGPQYLAPHDDPRLRGLFLLIRQDSVLVEQLKRALKPFKGLAYTCVFGSFATGRTHKGSDIDVLVLEDDGADRFAVITALSKVGEKFSREVDPQFYSVDDFMAKLAEGDPVVRDVIASPRINLKGAEPWQS